MSKIVTTGGASVQSSINQQVLPDPILTGDTEIDGDLAVTGTIDLSSISVDGIDVNGNLTFTGNARRITGNMSNATATNRLYFQNSVANSSTFLGVMPNGTGTVASINLENSSTIGNNGLFSISISPTETTLNSGRRGTGTFLPFSIVTGNGGLRDITCDINGNVAIGGNAGLATTATDRFLYLNSMAGTPTGVPNAPVGGSGTMTGKTPITVDTTNNLLYFYSSGAWRECWVNASSQISVGNGFDPGSMVIHGNGDDVGGTGGSLQIQNGANDVSIALNGGDGDQGGPRIDLSSPANSGNMLIQASDETEPGVCIIATQTPDQDPDTDVHLTLRVQGNTSHLTASTRELQVTGKELGANVAIYGANHNGDINLQATTTGTGDTSVSIAATTNNGNNVSVRVLPAGTGNVSLEGPVVLGTMGANTLGFFGVTGADRQTVSTTPPTAPTLTGTYATDYPDIQTFLNNTASWMSQMNDALLAYGLITD